MATPKRGDTEPTQPRKLLGSWRAGCVREGGDDWTGLGPDWKAGEPALDFAPPCPRQLGTWKRYSFPWRYANGVLPGGPGGRDRSRFCGCGQRQGNPLRAAVT